MSAFVSQTDFLEVELTRCEEIDEGLSDEAKTAMVRSVQDTFEKYVTVNPVSEVKCADRSGKKRICRRSWI